ncbi:MAG: response regulator [Chrysiogenetes bacterium]|nr:response regulator [Chrysiogenetes bacterium]
MKKILVAEDFEVLSKLIRNALKGVEAQLMEAYDGAEALKMALAEKPDLIIMDMDMPKMTGFDVTRSLRAKPEFAATPILMLTATGDERSARDAGVTAFMYKPYSPAKLREKVQELLDH